MMKKGREAERKDEDNGRTKITRSRFEMYIHTCNSIV